MASWGKLRHCTKSNATNTDPNWGVLARYEDPAALTHACEKVRDAGYKKWDAYCPFPVHDLRHWMASLPKDCEVVWVQEESMNQGAFQFAKLHVDRLLEE